MIWIGQVMIALQVKFAGPNVPLHYVLWCVKHHCKTRVKQSGKDLWALLMLKFSHVRFKIIKFFQQEINLLHYNIAFIFLLLFQLCFFLVICSLTSYNKLSLLQSCCKNEKIYLLFVHVQKRDSNVTHSFLLCISDTDTHTPFGAQGTGAHYDPICTHGCG